MSVERMIQPNHVQVREDQLSFVDVYELVKDNLVLLLGLPLVGLLLATYYGLSQTPVYKATALLQLDPRPGALAKGQESLYDPGYGTFQYHETQLRVLQSRKLAEKLAERLSLSDTKEFGGRAFEPTPIVDRVLQWLPGMPPLPPPAIISAEERFQKTVDRVGSAVSVELLSGTTLFKVGFQSEDPETAAQAANALADLYIEDLLQARLDMYTKANSWVAEKLGSVQTDLSSAESQLQEFRDERDLLSTGGNRGILEEELADISQQLRAAQRTRVSISSSYSEIQRLLSSGSLLTDAQPLLQDPLILGSAAALRQEQTKLRELEQRYGSRHPEYASTSARLDSLMASYQEQLMAKARSMASELEIAKANERSLRARERQVRNKLQSLDRAEFQLGLLERNLSKNKQLYDVFLERFKQTEDDAAFPEANARVADPAIKPQQPFQPQVKLLAVFGAIAGGVLALVFVTLRELLKVKVESPEDLENITSLPLLGVVPTLPRRLAKSRAADVVAKAPSGLFADSLRSIKTALDIRSRSASGHKSQVLAITSAQPAEGKTTLTLGLGATVAQKNKVLVIDGDLRRPRLASSLGVKSRSIKGLAEFLQSQATIEEVVQKDVQPGMDLIGAGATVANPGLLLESDALAQLLDWARNEYQQVFIDTAPILAASDCVQIAPVIDGYIVVTRAEKTTKKALLIALKRLGNINPHIQGIVLNGMPVRRSRYAGYYYYPSYYKG